jgi:WD40 repeat protein
MNLLRRRFVVAVLTVAAVLAAAGFGLVAPRSHGGAAAGRTATLTASQRRAIALSGRLAALADSVLRTNPRLAQLLAVEATRVADTPQARAALFRAATVPARAALVLSADAVIGALAVSADGSTAVAGTYRGQLTEVNLRTGARAQASGDSGRGAILGVAASANGTTVAAAYGTGAVVWRPGHAPVRLTVRGNPFSIAVSPSGHQVAVLSTLSGPLLKSLHGLVMPQALTVINLPRGTQVSTTSVAAAGFYGGFVMPAEPDMLSPWYFAELAFPSESTLRLIPTPAAFTDYSTSDLKVTARSSPTPAIAVVNASSANGAFYGEAGDQSLIQEWPAEAVPRYARAGNWPSDPPQTLTFSDDGRYAAALADGTITVDPMAYSSDPDNINVIPQSGQWFAAPADTTALAFAGDSGLISVSGSTLRLWNLAGNFQLSTAAGDGCCGGVSELAISPDGRYLFLDDGGGVVINAPGLPPLPDLAGDPATGPFQVQPDGGTIAVAWSGTQPLMAGFDRGAAHVIVVNPETRLNPGSSVGDTIQYPNGITIGSWPLPANLPSSLVAATSTSSGDIVIVRGGTAATVITFDPHAKAGRPRTVNLTGFSVPDGIELVPVAISRDGSGAVFAEAAVPSPPVLYGQPVIPTLSGSLVYVDLGTGAAHSLTPDGDAGAVVFSAKTLVLATRDGSVQEWDAAGDHRLLAFPRARIGTVGLTVSPDGTLLAAVNGATGVASVADAATGQVIATLNVPRGSHSGGPTPWDGTLIAFSPDDRYLFTSTQGGELVRWDIGESDLVNVACQRAGYNLTPAIWQRYVRTPPPRNLSCLAPPARH